MMRTIEKREGKGFEVQWYDDEGDNAKVVQCDTVEELAQYLSRLMWASLKPTWKNNPTVWHNGKRWCLHEETPANEDGKEY